MYYGGTANTTLASSLATTYSLDSSNITNTGSSITFTAPENNYYKFYVVGQGGTGTSGTNPSSYPSCSNNICSSSRPSGRTYYGSAGTTGSTGSEGIHKVALAQNDVVQISYTTSTTTITVTDHLSNLSTTVTANGSGGSATGGNISNLAGGSAGATPSGSLYIPSLGAGGTGGARGSKSCNYSVITGGLRCKEDGEKLFNGSLSSSSAGAGSAGVVGGVVIEKGVN